MKSRSREEDRKRLLEAGWEAELRDGLVVWRPSGRRSWYTQDVALELLEFLEEEGTREREES